MITRGRTIARFAAAVFVAGVGAVALASEAAAAPTASGPITINAGVFNPIRNVGNGKCLQPASPADGTPIIQKTCVTDPNDFTGRAAQSWRFQQVATNHYQFLNQLSGECFDVFGPAANGTRGSPGRSHPIPAGRPR